MDQEIGLKITHPVDDLASSSDFRIAKDDSGHVYESKETERLYILTAHLKGYRKEHVDIDINKDGTRIIIGLKKPVQEEAMSTKKKKGETGFRKVFRIPDGVALNRIKAKFNEQESTLRIEMPKLVKGIVGVRIEEVKEEGGDIETPQITQPASDEVPEKDGETMEAAVENFHAKEKDGEIMEAVAAVENFHAKGKEVDKEEYRKEIVVDHDQQLQAENPRENRESEEPKIVKTKHGEDGIEKEREDAKGTIEEEKHGEVKNDKSTEESRQVATQSQETEVTKPRIEEQKRPEKKKGDEMGKVKDVGSQSTPEKKAAAKEKSNPLRTPLIIVGSALLVSIVLLAINRIRNRKR